ncbi:MAG: SDR family oxidoreductase [Proteobacteria bacterium]|nr:SDR family oxidoreductase [Pseudomonadota bacterium]MBU1387242.1 SDR family oxidoreductase [Pseudomonadota bacterium]MBU1544902.1 SDR family oxidoreductase [Pseudomonadota bacterium]MBU2429797.1 SDR family oxidoreductase [Pseudomonadota bacterium]MBU2482517.1 SDR family oxidoreductase [Pseudomonadota bacterium]
MNKTHKKPVLVTGATGYVAGRLIPLLLASGYRVRAMGRSLPKLSDRPWGNHPDVQLVKGDILDIGSLRSAVKGCGAVYYLVHSMISQKGRYRDADRIGAKNMVQAAAQEDAEHLIYLGGLGDINHKNISRHLISRNEVGQILLDGPVPATVLRAAMILGSGSASFEILRYLAERLPVMVTPKWVSMPTQPISITNVLGYLKGCLEHPETKGKSFDIGGPDVLAYRDLFAIFARQANLPAPFMIPVPVLTPRLSSLWIHLVTPVPASIAQPLTEGLSLPTTCTENSITKIIPQDLISCSEAIRRALDRVQQEQVDTCWADAGQIQYPEWSQYGDSAYSGGTILSCGYQATVKGTPADLWKAIVKIGGRTGYYGADILWKIRGIIDIFTGGVGLSRGRRSKKELRIGDALDFWRVLDLKPESKLILLAEMKTPGDALLQIETNDLNNGQCTVLLLARFLPRGLTGLLYWYALYPFHQYVFTQMLKGIVNASGLKFIIPPHRYRPDREDTCQLGKD